MSLREGFYIESASTGRFRRCHVASEGDNTRGWRLPTLTPNSEDRESDVKVLFRIAFVGFLFLQGILSGLSLSAIYEAFSAPSPTAFFTLHSTRGNEVRRYFFIGISLCVTGSLCMLDEDVAAHAVDVLKGRKALSKTAKSNTILVLCYFAALMTTLLCSRVDVEITSITTQSSLYDDNLQSVIDRWRGFAVPRSLLCILGWLISCYRFVATRTSAQRDE